MYVCMCVCMCVRMHVRTYISLYVSKYVCTYTVLGTILGRIGPSWASSRTSIENLSAALAHLRPPAIKMMIFHWFLKQK